MKAKIPDQFFLHAQKYTLDSMIKSVIHWSFEVYNDSKSESNGFFGNRNTINNNRRYNILIVQTWLLDMIYDLIIHNRYGAKIITNDECLYLIGLYNDYLNSKSGSNRKSRNDVLFEAVGFFGEQCRFQTVDYFEEYSRETYMLEDVSKRINDSKIHFDFEEEFFEEMNISSLVLSKILFSLFAFYITNGTGISIDCNSSWFNKLQLNHEEVQKVIDRYSIDISGVRNSENKRQVFYLKPLIHLGNVYYLVNPFLLLESISNSKYWIIRERYRNKNSKKEQSIFVNAFGKMFENYVEEILQNCLSDNEYEKIPEVNNAKRADWKLTLGSYTILVEQKSSHPVLKIKQNEADIESVKNYMKKCLGEAVDQLIATEQAYNLNHTIKIVLTYDSYFRSEAFDLLFMVRTDVVNDGYYWLVNISEFENLMFVYKNDKELFNIIVAEKINSVNELLKTGQNLETIFYNHDVLSDSYLNEFGIMKKVDEVF